MGTKTRLEAMQAATTKEIETLKAKLQKKADKLVRRDAAGRGQPRRGVGEQIRATRRLNIHKLPTPNLTCSICYRPQS